MAVKLIIDLKAHDCSSWCGEKGSVFPVKVQIPDFSKGVIIKEKNVCSKCLEVVNEAYLRHQRKEIDGRTHAGARACS